MHPRIAAVPNKLFYSGRLENAPGLDQKTAPIVQSPPTPGEPLAYYDLTALNAWCSPEQESHSRFNFVSALITVALAQQARGAGQRVGIVTPYNAQSRLIHRLLSDLKITQEEIMVATVHRFQGSERDVILFDAVEGWPAKPGLLVSRTEESGPMRLANVAVSRAKGKFIAVANASYIKDNLPLENHFRQLFVEVENQVTPFPVTWPVHNYITEWNMHLPTVTVYDQCRHAAAALEQDMLAASEEIAIYWPTRINNFHFSPDTLKRLGPHPVRLHIGGLGSMYFPDNLRNTRLYPERRLSVPYGVIAIDRKRLWVYTQPDSPLHPLIHIRSPQTTKLLYAFWKLVPDDELKQKTIGELLESDTSPVSKPCPRCGQFLYPTPVRSGAYYSCVNPECGHSQRMTESDATNLARLMNVTCDKCGGQVVGRKGQWGVFLACTNYPGCRGRKDLSELV